MSSFAKMLSIIDLFSEEKPVWTAEEIAENLGVSIPTAYRYLKELCQSGLLARSTGGLYFLGSKIIELDYQIRTSDPIMLAGKPIMQALRDKAGSEIMLSHIYNDRILIIHEERTSENLMISFSRGRMHPLFQSATSKIILAYLPKNQLDKLSAKYEALYASKAVESWDEFKAKLGTLRREGFSISHGEIDTNLTAIAAPVFTNQQIRGSLSMVMPTQRYELFNKEKITEAVIEAAQQLSDALSRNEVPEPE
ncbi:IclR family transcriptional regulator [Brevibacillus centrosporus]|uniref:IclR family transcriptional regulator n=1 Tax=Brevibacillus centrosporus TaxID=54910 RepID=UPI002E220643|nr:IclR family transcriptional regulator [Brevibacillus centrosporus]